MLAACATPARIAGRPGVASFDRTGRFAVTVDRGNAGRKAVQGGFSWHDDGAGLTLDLANPLGSTLARVTVTPAGATLLRANGTSQQAPSADALVAQVLGSPIPVAGLRDWLRGRTQGGATGDLKKNAAGQVESFTQDGWLVRLSNYDTQGPRLLRMLRDGPDGRISVRLAVDSR